MAILPVLICGAGPTGLLMACLLAHYGIKFRIIDQNEEPTTASNATLIQPATLELLSQLNLDTLFLKFGNQCNEINLYVDGKQVGALNLNIINHLYNYVLTLPQNITEKLLIDYLNNKKIQIERPVKLTNVEAFKTFNKCVLLKKNKKHQLKCRYLIACDGANSSVRQVLKLKMPGKDLQEQFVVADATIKSFKSNEALHVFLNPKKVFIAIPLGGNRYRINANLALSETRKFYYPHEIATLTQERAFGEYYVSEVEWVSPYWVHEKVMKVMSKYNVFFAGDSAHLHSPAFGHGMNTGMQDAVNLAWKIAYVLKKYSPEKILNSYQQERYTVIKQTADFNNYFTDLILSKPNAIQLARQFGKNLSKLSENKYKKIVNQLMQLNVEYVKSPIIDYFKQNNLVYHAGNRLSNFKINEKQTFYDLLVPLIFNLVIFLKTPNTTVISKVKNILKQSKDFADQIQLHVISDEASSNINMPMYVDKEKKIFKKLKIKESMLYIIRPDYFICFASKGLNEKHVTHYLHKIFS